MFDLLIKNGMVLDGTGAPRFLADVAVQGDRIVEIAPHIEGEAKRVIDAEGLFVYYGIVDHVEILKTQRIFSLFIRDDRVTITTF